MTQDPALPQRNPADHWWRGRLVGRMTRPFKLDPVEKRLEQVGHINPRVLYISAFDTRGGAAIASHRLINRLDAQEDVAALELVGRQQSTSPWTVSLDRAHGFFAWREARKAFAGRNDLMSDPYGWLPIDAAYIMRIVKAWQPDVVHLHNIHGGWGVLPHGLLPAISKHAPIVWTLHDMWLATGHCAYSMSCERWKTGCGQCPDLSAYPALRIDRSRGHAKRKARHIDKSRPTLVSPSRWLAGVMEDSAVTAGQDVRVIPNGLDTSVFTPAAREQGRNQVGLEANELAIMFAAEALDAEERKGAVQMREALIEMQNARRGAPVTVILMGGGGDGLLDGIDGLNVHKAGFVSEPEDAARLYAAADLFVCPSLQDNLPNTLLEASASGTASIVFDAGGCGEVIEDGVTGHAVAFGDSTAMGRQIAEVLSDPDRLAEMGRSARLRAQSHYSDTRMAADYLALYNELIGAREAGKTRR